MQNNNSIFDKYLDDKIDEIPTQKEQEKQEIVVKEQTTTQVATPQKLTLAERFLNQVVAYAETSGETLDQKTKSLAVEIITATNKVIVSNQYRWNEIDVQGCGFDLSTAIVPRFILIFVKIIKQVFMILLLNHNIKLLKS